MKRRALILGIGLVCTTLSTLLHASVCASLVKSIHQDVNQYGKENIITNKRLAWMNIYWLKKRLGNGAVSKNFDIAADDSDKQQLQYTWRCPENEDTRLVATVNRKGLVTRVEGQYSSEEGAELFLAAIPQNGMNYSQPEPAPVAPQPQPESQAPAPAPKPEPAPEEKQKPAEKTEATDNSLSALLDPYNKHFHSTIQSKDALVADMVDKVKLFYKNLRDCKPGVYDYSIYLQSGFIFPVSTIDGNKNGLCHVETVFTVAKLGNVKATCLYKPENLTVYTDSEAESLVKGKSFDKDNPSPRDKAEADACDTYVNGTLQPKLVAAS